MGPLTEGGYAGGVPGLEDFDRYVAAHGIPAENHPAAFALWLAEITGGPMPRSRRSSGRSRPTES
jgi:hypothetical protein